MVFVVEESLEKEILPVACSGFAWLLAYCLVAVDLQSVLYVTCLRPSVLVEEGDVPVLCG